MLEHFSIPAHGGVMLLLLADGGLPGKLTERWCGSSTMAKTIVASTTGLFAATVQVLFNYNEILHNSLLVRAAGLSGAHRASGLALSLGNLFSVLALAFTAASSKADQAAIAETLAAHGLHGFAAAWLGDYAAAEEHLRTAVEFEPGMPKVSVGTSAVHATVLLAASGAATPSGEPLPNSSGRRDQRRASL